MLRFIDTDQQPLTVVIPGNPNLPTLESAIVVIQRYFKRQIGKVVIIDNADSFYKDGKNIEAERNQRIRAATSEFVELSQQIIPKDNLGLTLPAVLLRELKSSMVGDICVDLTNGQKITSSLLYATATLLGIPNLFFLTVKTRGKEASALDEADYQVDVLQPLQEIEKIGHQAFLELINFRRTTEELFAENLSNFGKLGIQVAESERWILQAVESHFNQSFPTAIQNCGKLGEELARTWIQKLRTLGKFKEQKNQDYSSCVSAIRKEICDPIRGGEKEHPFDWLRPLATLDTELDLLRIYRNIAAHPTGIDLTREMSRIALETIICCLRNSALAVGSLPT